MNNFKNTNEKSVPEDNLGNRPTCTVDGQS